MSADLCSYKIFKWLSIHTFKWLSIHTLIAFHFIIMKPKGDGFNQSKIYQRIIPNNVSKNDATLPLYVNKWHCWPSASIILDNSSDTLIDFLQVFMLFT